MKHYENARRLPAVALTLSLAVLGALPNSAWAVDESEVSTEQGPGTGEAGDAGESGGGTSTTPRPMCTTFPDCPTRNLRPSDNDSSNYWQQLLEVLGAEA